MKRYRFGLQSAAFLIIVISSAILYFSVSSDHPVITGFLLAIIAAAMLLAVFL